MNLDDWLSQLYKMDNRAQLAQYMPDFKAALAASPDLMAAAQARLVELDALIKKRSERACAYSTKYWKYLTEALAS
jgi:hypothetical protein